MSGTSGRRRTADCGIRWSTAMLGTDHVRTTVSRRAAGAGKRALTEYRRARLALSLGIVVIGGGGGGSGDGITRGDKYACVPSCHQQRKLARARAITRGSLQARNFRTRGEPSFLARATIKLCRRNLRAWSYSSRSFLLHADLYLTLSFRTALVYSRALRVLAILKLSFRSESLRFTAARNSALPAAYPRFRHR